MSTLALINGVIRTLDPERPVASALAVSDGEVVATGGDAGVLGVVAQLGGAAEVVDLGGRCVLPGLTDAHIHFAAVARRLREVDVETATLEEALDRVAARVAGAAAGEWVVGGGWNQNLWGGYPTAADLDRVAPGNPVYLVSKSYHAAWVNGRALELAGLGRDAVAPAGGELQRTAGGELTGIVFEWPAMSLIAAAVPRQTAAQLAASLHPAMDLAWRAGLTGVHCFDGDDALAAYVTLHERGELGLRVVKMILRGEHEAAIAAGLRSGAGDEWLRIGNLKIVADGAMSQQTALMTEPYESSPGTGIAVTPKEELRELALEALTAGLALSVHAIGDRANHDVLDVLAEARRVEAALAAASPAAGDARRPPLAAPDRPPRLLRHRIEHVQLIATDDLARLARLGVIASMQPIHATSDMEVAERLWGARTRFAYRWRDVLATGAPLAFGSDAPVESLDPFWGLHAAVTRRRADGAPGPDGWYPSQRLTVDEALRAFTLGPAYAAGLEHRLGSLEPGKAADLVVCDRDVYACDPDDIRDTVVVGTMVGGVWRYRAADFG